MQLLMKKFFLLLTMLFLFQHFTYSQKKGKEFRDSLFSVLRTQKGNIAEVNTLNILSYQFRNNNTDTSIYLAGKALALSVKLGYSMGISDSHYYLYVAYIHLLQCEEVLNNFRIAIVVNN